MGYCLSMQREDKRLQFHDMVKLECPTEHKGHCSSRDQCVTIMIDDLSLLEMAASGSVDHVLDFLHYCVVLTSELDCSLVILTLEDTYPSGEVPRLGIHCACCDQDGTIINWFSC